MPMPNGYSASSGRRHSNGSVELAGGLICREAAGEKSPNIDAMTLGGPAAHLLGVMRLST
jgi:hypothetical protein